MPEKIGFIGLGIMGLPMARNLMKAGHELVVHDHKRSTMDELAAEGAEAADDPRAVAERAGTIITMLPNSPHVAEVVDGEKGILRGARDGALVVDMSSISPVVTLELARKARERGVGMVDAPVSGGDVGAREGALSIMAGGSEEDFRRAEPLFEPLGKTVVHVGEVGAGQVVKACNQIVVALTIEAVAEALVFASKAGADPAKVRQALMGGLAASRILEVHGERMVKRTFDPGFRIELHQKDLNLALQGAKALGVALPNTATAQELFNTCAANGLGKQDHSALCRAIEIMSNHDIA